MKHSKKTLVCALLILGFSTFGTPATVIKNSFITETNATEARAFIYEWYYKVIDGHLYKRLYNATLGEWEGDWILVQ